MKQSEFIEELEDIMDLESGTLTLDAKLADLEEWTSLAVVGFIAFVDESCGLTLEAQRIKGCETVSDLAQLLEGRVE